MNKPLLQKRGPQSDVDLVIADIAGWMGARITTSQSVLEQHGRGESWHPVHSPDAVCFAHSTEEVARIVAVCAEHLVPIIAFGAGSSLEGHLQALAGGICIDLSQMNQVISINAADLDCRVQAGVTRKQLNTELRDTGLFFPVDPGADASIGGMTATRASGTNAVRYGTMRENVMSLTYVDAGGNIVQTGSRAKKSSAGFDLTHLLVGSEGTLGIITEIGLRLHGLPEVIKSAVVDFPSVSDAVKTVMDVIQIGLPMARIELVDRAYMRAINAYSKTEYPERDTLFLEFHGTQLSVDEQVSLFKELATEYGSGEFCEAQKEEERTMLWKARHDAYYAVMAANPGTQAMTTDVCVPISKLAEIIEYIRDNMIDSSFQSELLGHVGDGNFHMLFCVAPGDDDAMQEALGLNELLVNRALELGGTCTGEHGIGMGKLKYLRREHGDAAVDTMRAIKRALDPHNLLNPGKTIDV
ncbi:MAG: FAD-binding oxidoreductase [Granulosicoccus sp.]